MKPLTLNINRLLTPLQGGRQEPADCEDQPPDTASHPKKVDDHEEEGAAPVLHAALPDRSLQLKIVRHLVPALCASNRVVVGESNDVANSNSGIAGGEVDDWPLRIGKPRAIYQVR